MLKSKAYIINNSRCTSSVRDESRASKYRTEFQSHDLWYIQSAFELVTYTERRQRTEYDSQHEHPRIVYRSSIRHNLMTVLPTSVPASISSNILWVTEHQVSIGIVKKVTERWNVLIDLFEPAKRSMDLDLSAREKIEGFGGILERAEYNV